MSKKYKLRKDLSEEVGAWYAPTIVYRIEALLDFGDVKKGDLGGYVASKRNLSQMGDCWVYDNAAVYGKALVHQDAKVRDYAHVYGRAEIAGDACIEARAKVLDKADVWGNAVIGGYATCYEQCKIYGKAKVFGNTRVGGSVVIEGKAKVSLLVDEELDGVLDIQNKCTHLPLYLSGLTWRVTITDKHMTIGCQTHTQKKWFAFNDPRIDRMDSEALAFWRENKKILKKLCKKHRRKKHNEFY